MRKVLLPSLIILATSLLVVRIFYLQIVDDTLKLKSENNAIKKKYDYQNAVIFMTEGGLWLPIKLPMTLWLFLER
jgi:cell division protein FtsI/penicillin-binding protein 2